MRIALIDAPDWIERLCAQDGQLYNEEIGMSRIDSHDAATIAGKTDSVVLGGDTNVQLALDLLSAGVHVMINDIFSYGPQEWVRLEQAAQKHKCRLLCSQNVTRFYADASGDPEHGVAHIEFTHSDLYAPDVARSLVIPADAAMFDYNSIPQVVFACRDSRAENDLDATFASATLRFERGASALLSARKSKVDFASINIDNLTADAYSNPQADNNTSILDPFVTMLEYLAIGINAPKVGVPCSSLSRTAEAILVSINTGAPVYIADEACNA